MKVKDAMEKRVITVPVGATYEEVATVLCTHGVSGVPVVDGKGRVVGLVSETDLYRILYPFYSSFYETPSAYADLEARETKIEEVKGKRVEEFMSTKVITIEPDAPIMRAGGLMLAKHVHRLPVMKDRKLVGIITRSRIYRTILAKHLGLKR